MSIHSITEYIRYRRKANNRHGIHSPFAYAFVEDVIEDRKHISIPDITIPWTSTPENRIDTLLKRILAYYQYSRIINLIANENGKGTYDVLLIDNNPEKWQHILAHNSSLIGNDSVVIISGIHYNKAHSTAWQKVCENSIVRMSIDLYHIGLLFYKTEFLVKQHFILKGPK